MNKKTETSEKRIEVIGVHSLTPIYEPVGKACPPEANQGKSGDQVIAKFKDGHKEQGYFVSGVWFYSMVQQKHIHLPKGLIVGYMVIPE